MNLMMAPLNPNMYTGWANMAVDPKTYGTWGSFMNPATYGNLANPFAAFVPAAPAAPAAK
jgi:hypothetical protein